MGRGTDENGEMSPEEWANSSAFEAQLLGSGIIDWVSTALLDIRGALENPHNPPELGDCYVISAAQWILYAGKELFSDRRQPRDAKDQSLRTGTLFPGPPGVSLERWQFWKKRFGELGAQLGNEAKKEAEAAIIAMEAI